MQTNLVNQAGIERLPIILHQTVRDDYLGEGLGSGVLIGHQGANNTRLSTCSMRQSPYLIEQSYLDLICPYSTEQRKGCASSRA